MKILVLCVDRDDDIGVKTGIKTPLIGREANLNAATKLGLADPEDSDVNALLSAVSTYDGLVRDVQLAEIATICVDVHVGTSSDLILILAGLYLLMISLPFQSVGDVLDRAGELYNRLRDSVASGNLSIFFNVSALILVLVGISFGVDSASRVAEPSYVVKFLAGALASVWFFVLGLLLFEGGKVLTAYMQHGRAPRHALAVAVTFIAVGFIVLAMINILGVLLASYNLNAALWPIYLSIALAIFLVVTGGLSYRTREPRSETVEDG